MEQSVDVVPEKSLEELKSIFEPFDVRFKPEKYKLQYPKGLLQKASVLIPLCFKNGEYHLILTLRSEKLTHHAGYVAFPGGMKDETDIDEIHTALREAEEEIGLKPEDVKIIGVFGQSIVKPNSLVYPVIGLVSSDYVPVVNEREVSLVFEIPLRRFLLTERRRISDFQSPINATYHIHHFIDYVNGKEIDTWGYTASLCVMTALGIYQTDHSFCFYEYFISNKETLFKPLSTRAQKSSIKKVSNSTYKMATGQVICTPTVEQLKEHFLPFDRRHNEEKFKLHNIPDNLLKTASVLIPLFYKNGEIHVLLTVRTKNMPSHAGQVAFPGGMSEPDDADAIATALREAEEEVGIRPNDVKIIAVLSSYIVRPNSLVTGVLGLLPNDFELKINPREVDMVFDLPLERFLSSEGRTHTSFKFDAELEFNVYHFLDLVQGCELDTWGFSAMLCIQVAIVTFQSDLGVCFYKDFIVTKANSFNTTSTQAIIDNWSAKAKL